MPLFLRGGSILPLGPTMQWTDQKPNGPMEIRVVPGADVQFKLYQDAGDGFGYTRGEYSTITLNWDDDSRKFTIGERQGQYPGVAESFMVNVILVGEGCGVGVSTSSAHAAVTYTGQAIEIDLSE
jgi:alpha-D-xyloside xylohydrolase